MSEVSGASPRDWLVDTTEETLGCDRAGITDDARLTEDLGADSLDALELVMVAEDHYRIEIADADLVGVMTFGDMVALVERKLAA